MAYFAKSMGKKEVLKNEELNLEWRTARRYIKIDSIEQRARDSTEWELL